VTILTGFGCWCDTVDTNNNNIPDTCEDPNARRHLMGSGGTVRQSASVEISFEGGEESKDDPGCTINVVICWIQAFIASLLAFFGF